LGMFQASRHGPRIFNRSLCLSLHQRTIFYNLKNGESLSELWGNDRVFWKPWIPELICY
jgi:hypothetical protein